MRAIIATTNIDRKGEKFSKEVLQGMVDTFNKAPIFDNFDVGKCIGWAYDPKIEGENLTIELKFNSNIKVKGYSVICYLVSNYELISIGIVKEPMDKNVDHFSIGIKL